MIDATRLAPALLAAGLAGLGPAHNAAAQADRPNVLFILTEDGGAFDSVVGTAGVQTPGLESIVDRGFYFTNAHVAAPVCSVSKAAMLTGLMPHANNTRTNVAKAAFFVVPACFLVLALLVVAATRAPRAARAAT